MVRLVSDGEPAPEAPLPPDGREKIINFPLSRSSRMERSMADVPRALAVFFVAGCAEIGGGWLVWQWVREDRPWPFGLLGGLVLAGYGLVATLQKDAEFGRVYAAYGGVFIALSLGWGIVVDGWRPDRWDVTGAAVAVLGMAIMMFAPRGS